MDKFFVNRPVFAIVLSIIIMLAGIISIFNLPIAQYPNISPPTVRISATYPGASAETVENSITQVIEKELTGLDGLLYFSSTSDSSGNCNITLTFKDGINPDTAQVQVQNKVQQIVSRFPDTVQRNGVRVTKSLTDILMFVSLYDETGKDAGSDVADYLLSNIQDPLSRVDGVGSVNLIGSQYSMRIWMDPNKMRSYNLMPSDVKSAIEQQNVQIAAGKIGEPPATNTQNLTATVTAVSMMQTPEEFKNIIVKHNSQGASVKLGDVAQVEMGSQSYAVHSKLNGHPAAAMVVQLASGANSLTTAQNVRDYISSIESALPDGYKFAFPNDTSRFVRISVNEVVKTLVEAIGLVIVVMFVFLRKWRITIIPALTVPVVLLGTFAVLAFFGYTINTLTLFAMVLAIGLLVDDTIVVVENVERVIREEKLSPKEATAKSMKEITSALIGIAVVLSVVFVPMIFFSGSTGVIYRQFAVTIISAMALSVFVALTLAPALCGMLIKPHDENEKPGWFQKLFDKTLGRYENGVDSVVKKPVRWMAVYGAIIVAMLFIMARIPTGFLPNEDQGSVMVSFTLPEGADLSRTIAVSEQIEKYFTENESENLDQIFMNAGYSFNGQNQNEGMAIIILKDWSERKGKYNQSASIARRAMGGLQGLRDARVYAMIPPPIMGLGMTDGFELYLQAEGDTSRNELEARKNEMLGKANGGGRLAMVRAEKTKSAPQLHINFNNDRIFAHNLNLNDVYNTISYAWAGYYVNDFVDRSKIKRVYIQSVPEYRSKPEDIFTWTVRNSKGEMVPFSEFAETGWIYSPETLERFNGVPAYNVQGTGAAGMSSGQAMQEISKIAKDLKGTTFAWSGLSYQENQATGQTLLLYGLAIFVVFLCLAALYESWSVPIAVLMVIPLGIIGAVLATQIRGLENNVYFQMALLTTIGLSSKNAIMMVEFAESAYKNGKGLVASAVDAAKLRLRPILMTSFAFVAGVLPLAVSTGVGANSRIAIGTGIVGGTVTATALSIFMVPLFFVLVNRVFSKNAGGVK